MLGYKDNKIILQKWHLFQKILFWEFFFTNFSLFWQKISNSTYTLLH